jgi:hypothetical protein
MKDPFRGPGFRFLSRSERGRFHVKNALLTEERLDADEWVSFVLAVASSQLNRTETSRMLKSLLERGLCR